MVVGGAGSNRPKMQCVSSSDVNDESLQKPQERENTRLAHLTYDVA